MIGDLHERNALRHPVVLTVEDHRPPDRPGPRPFARDRQLQRLWLRHTAYRKITHHVKALRARLHHLGRPERDLRILLHVEKILPLQLAVFHAASRIHRSRLDPEVQHSRPHIARSELERCVPPVELSRQRHRSLDIELDRAVPWSRHKDRRLRADRRTR